MYTRCPKCEALYPVEATDLRAGRGEVLCSQCHIIFSALSALADKPEQAHADPYAAGRVPALGRNDAVDKPIVSLRAEPRLRQATDRPNVDHFDAFESAPAGTSLLWSVAALVAVAALFCQAVIFESDRLTQQPALRPWLAWLCPPLHCHIPEFRDLSHIEVVDRSLTPARNGVDGLEFRTVLANYADQSQPYPRLKLTLSQYNGEPIAQRIFIPQDYIQKPVGIMPVGEAVEIHLIIANPGKDVGGFNFELR